MNDQNKHIMGIHEKHHPTLRKWIAGLAVLILAIVSYLGYSNPELFQASLIGGGEDATVSTDLYIPNNYKASADDEVMIEVFAGTAISGVKKMNSTIKVDGTKAKMIAVDKTGGIFENEPNFTSTVQADQVVLGDPFKGLSKSYDIKDNDLIAKIKVQILEPGATIDFKQIFSTLEYNAANPRSMSFRDGKLVVNPPPNLTGGNIQLTDADLYIPLDYKTSAGEKGLIDVRIGKDLIAPAGGIEALKVVLTADKDQLKFLQAYSKGSVLDGANPVVKITDGQIEIDYTNLSKEYNAKDNDTLFQVLVQIDPRVVGGTDIPVQFDGNSFMKIAKDSRTSGFVPAVENGKIVTTISSNARSNIKDLVAMVLTLDQDGLNKLTPAEQQMAYKNAYLFLNSSAAAGKTLTIGPKLNTITIPTPNANGVSKFKIGNTTEEEAKIRAIMEDPDGNAATEDGLIHRLEKNNTELLSKVTTYPGIIGLVKLEPNINNQNGFYNAKSNTGEVLILPALDSTLDLKTKTSYKLRLVGKNKNGSLTPITFDDVTIETTDILNKTLIPRGLLEGLKKGSTSLLVSAKNAANEVIKSNAISVNVPEPLKLASIVISIAEDTLKQLPANERQELYKSAYVLINASSAAGESIILNKRPLAIPSFDSSARTEEEKIKSITEKLATSLSAGTDVQRFPDVPGLLKISISPSKAPDVSSFDGIQITSGDAAVVPAVDSIVNLPPNRTYRLRLIGKNNDGSLRPLTFNDVKWQPQPVNQVDKTSLDGGLLKRGDKTGTTSVYVEATNADNQVIKSNQFAVRVASEPIIEYMRMVGSAAIERGSTFNISAKVSDTDEIKDIKDIRTAIIKTSATNYGEILKDSSAVWFTTSSLVSQVKTDGASQGANVKENFKIYTIPVVVPQDARLINGPYQLLLEITDNDGKVAAATLPIQMGLGASGDLNNDGKVTMLDVITAFQIANGQIASPSAGQIKAADVNNDGKVTMLDVVTIFQKVK